MKKEPRRHRRQRQRRQKDNARAGGCWSSASANCPSIPGGNLDAGRIRDCANLRRGGSLFCKYGAAYNKGGFVDRQNCSTRNTLRCGPCRRLKRCRLSAWRGSALLAGVFHGGDTPKTGPRCAIGKTESGVERDGRFSEFRLRWKSAIPSVNAFQVKDGRRGPSLRCRKVLEFNIHSTLSCRRASQGKSSRRALAYP